MPHATKAPEPEPLFVPQTSKRPAKCRARARRHTPDHTHTCTGHHYADPDVHWCPVCQVWWWNTRTTTQKETRR
jgi:hypothetical protein